jgi:hypothetical protein
MLSDFQNSYISEVLHSTSNNSPTLSKQEPIREMQRPAGPPNLGKNHLQARVHFISVYSVEFLANSILVDDLLQQGLLG